MIYSTTLPVAWIIVSNGMGNSFLEFMLKEVAMVESTYYPTMSGRPEENHGRRASHQVKI
jgi:hypothetical protein